MEQQFPAENKSLFELQVDYESGNRFKEVSKWGKFIAIVYFICIGFLLLGLTFGATFVMGIFSSTMPGIDALGGVFIAALFVIAGVYIYITIQLFRFASLVREGVERQDQTTFNNALKSLRNYLMASGIVSLVLILYSVYDTIKAFVYSI